MRNWTTEQVIAAAAAIEREFKHRGEPVKRAVVVTWAGGRFADGTRMTAPPAFVLGRARTGTRLDRVRRAIARVA